MVKRQHLFHILFLFFLISTHGYRIETYPTFPNQEYAWNVIKFEHRLEFFMEGFRFFNLIRWGDAAELLHKYLD